MISTSIKVVNAIINQINSEFNICNINKNKIKCLIKYFDIINKKNLNLIINN